MHRLCARDPRPSRRPARLTPALAAIAAAALAQGCGSPRNTAAPTARAERPLEARAEQGARVPVLVNGEPIGWDQLRPALAESVGSEIVAELALERVLEQEMRRRGMSLGAGAVDDELEILRRELETSPGEDRHALLERVREQRGLGEARFARLLRRSAMLRALARDAVTLEPREIDLAEQIRYGQRREALVIVTPTEREASALRSEILAAGSPSDAFMARAAQHSIDASASRGGQLGAVSPVDPAFPDALRRAISATPPGGLTQILAIEQGFAFAMVTRSIPEETAPAGARARIEAELRRRKQRLEMDRVATRLMDQAKITVLDRSLAWSWDASRSGR